MGAVAEEMVMFALIACVARNGIGAAQAQSIALEEMVAGLSLDPVIKLEVILIIMIIM
jgi:hypothetical protein